MLCCSFALEYSCEDVCNKLPSVIPAPHRIPLCLLGIGGARSNDLSDWWAMIVVYKRFGGRLFVLKQPEIGREEGMYMCVCSSCRTGLSKG